MRLVLTMLTDRSETVAPDNFPINAWGVNPFTP